MSQREIPYSSLGILLCSSLYPGYWPQILATLIALNSKVQLPSPLKLMQASVQPLCILLGISRLTIPEQPEHES